MHIKVTMEKCSAEKAISWEEAGRTGKTARGSKMVKLISLFNLSPPGLKRLRFSFTPHFVGPGARVSAVMRFSREATVQVRPRYLNG